jgi:hypothetical protein
MKLGSFRNFALFLGPCCRAKGAKVARRKKIIFFTFSRLQTVSEAFRRWYSGSFSSLPEVQISIYPQIHFWFFFNPRARSEADMLADSPAARIWMDSFGFLPRACAPGATNMSPQTGLSIGLAAQATNVMSKNWNVYTFNKGHFITASREAIVRHYRYFLNGINDMRFTQPLYLQ